MSEFTSILLTPQRVVEFFRERQLPEPQYRIYADRTVFIRKDGLDGVDPVNFLPELHREFPRALLRFGNVPWVENLVKRLIDRKEMVSTAESCTGGLIGTLLTDIPGSSKVYWGGVITYSNEAKVHLLGVPERVLLENGAVSRETVTIMAQQAMGMGNTQWGIGVSGIAGPTGGTTAKPVGTVFIALAGLNGFLRVERIHVTGSRQEIRKKSAILSLLLLESCVCKEFDIDIERLNAYI